MVIFTNHARMQMARRHISEAAALEAVEGPQQTIYLSGRRYVHQNRYFDPIEGKEMIIRVFVEPSTDDMIVVSAYRTSQISEYWIDEPPE